MQTLLETGEVRLRSDLGRVGQVVTADEPIPGLL